MRALIVTKIFPNRVEPASSPFNLQQFRALSRLCELEILATIPWFPGAGALSRWSAAGRLVSVPKRDEIAGLRVRHPRFAFIPKLGHGVTGPLYAASLATTALCYRGRVDVVLGCWAYPDGFAAVLLAEWLGVPAVIKLHGSDMNVVARLSGPRRRLQWALRRVARVVAVSRPLAEAAAALGAPRDRIDIVPNGVDREAFQPRDRAEARRALGLPLDVPLVLYVGHVTAQKGAVDLIEAFKLAAERLGGAELVLVGDGDELQACRLRARQVGLCAYFAGAQPHERIPTWLAACDVLCLPSWSEGMPNVVLEALASGRAVVASRVGAIPELLTGPPHALVPPRDPSALARALENTLATRYEPSEIASALDRPDWAGSARLLHESLLAALTSRASEAA
ncbi:MAG TPA: glycosyltransferase family 4 protein [Polyangiaceae bacterium]|nr:glycosyltransferase family 4 protein [Polyangiaceae bacterium]